MSDEKNINILRNTLLSIIEPRKKMRSMSPTWLASEAMHILDPQNISVPPVAVGCHEHLKQISRDILSKKFWEAEDEKEEQHSLWPELQTRYPKAHSKKGGDPEYILLEFCTDEDLDWNIDRLESEARAKQKHADALRAYKGSRDNSASA